jgi:Tol biopolymer transport system component
VKRIGALALAALLGLMVSASLAEAQYFGQNKVQYRRYDWRSISSEHFDVYFYPGEDSLSLRVLDLAEKAHVYLSQIEGHTLEHRVPIILYGSHNDFSQTNVTPELIDGSTGGFTEVLHNRVVLPFTGSYEDLRHVVVHELTHAIMFDKLYGGSAASLIARQGFYQIPLWFAEGLAEYTSLGTESNEIMFLRDGTIEGYLPPLQYSGGYIVYKQGQSAITYLVNRFGADRLKDILEKSRQMHNFDAAFQRSTGTTVEKFDEQWHDSLKKQYWPTVASKEDADVFARRLTDHRRDESNLNTSPAVSPQGDRIAYFSDRHQYTDVYVMSAFDGGVQGRIIRGEQSRTFEGLPTLRGSISWSPDGTQIALVAISAGRDVLYRVDAVTGKVLGRYDLHSDSAEYPAWSPVSDSIAVTCVRDGRSDLYVLNAKTGALARLTNDNWDEKEPTWSPDGRTLTFASDRLAPVVLQAQHKTDGFGSYAIYNLDLATGAISQLVHTYGDDHSPAWSPDGRRLAFISDRNGTPNIFLFDPQDSTVTELTDVLGGVFSLSWSRQNDRLVFSAFNHGGFDVFAVNEPLSVESVLARLRRDKPNAVESLAHSLIPPSDSLVAPPNQGALAITWNDSLSSPRDTTVHDLGHLARGHGAAHDTSTTLASAPPAVPTNGEPPSWGEPFGPGMPNAAGASTAASTSMPPPAESQPHPLPPAVLTDRGGPFALSDSILSQEPAPYKSRLTADYFGGGVYAATGYGFVGSTQLQFSDFLGDRNLFVAADLASSALSETNILAIYSYLPNRLDYQLGAFHFKNYFSSRVTTFGEALGGPRLFSDQNFGVLFGLAYPIDRFRRVELDLTQTFVNRQFFDQDIFGNVAATSSEFESITSPTFSLVGDNTLFGYYGPVNGGRHIYTLSLAPPLFPNALSYITGTIDTRRYWDLTHGYTFATRALGGVSGGTNPQTFQVGGYSTLRGYGNYALLGTRFAVGSLELRYPFIQQLGVVGPVPVGLFNLRGASFVDVGAVWSANDPMRFWGNVNGKRVLAAPRVGFGTGIRTSALFMIFKLDVAWRTNLNYITRPYWFFSIGPEF